MPTAFENMDKMYRHQRYVYDLTRKYYLLGRDKLISQLEIKPGENILEIGCGTGRNLAILSSKYPESYFFGLDASAIMLETALSKIKNKGLQNIRFQKALADDFSFDETFGLDKPFDTVFFSYSISMIPTWEESIANALHNLKAGRSIYLVDFYDQRDLPKWFRKVLMGWLNQFHAKYPRDLIPHLKNLEKDNKGELEVKSIYKSYSFIARFRRH